MIKIKTLFKRDPKTRNVIPEYNDECMWVVNEWDHVTATRKWDGSATLIDNGTFYKRYDARLKKLGDINLHHGGLSMYFRKGIQVKRGDGRKFKNGKRLATVIGFKKHPVNENQMAVLENAFPMEIKKLIPIGVEMSTELWKQPNQGFQCQDLPDFHSHHWPWWVPVAKFEGNNNEYLPDDVHWPFQLVNDWIVEPVGEDYNADHWHIKGLCHFLEKTPSNNRFDYNGTYELVGPKVNGNKDGFATHGLQRHGNVVVPKMQMSSDFTFLEMWLEMHDVEGIVFHHKDGRMAKIRRKDYGLTW